MAFVLPAYLAPYKNLIQDNALTRWIGDTLVPASAYRLDATREKLEPGTGETAAFSRLGALDVTLQPAPRVGATPRGQFKVEQYTADPEPFANSLDIDAPTAYVQKGNRPLQTATRLADWAGRTSSRKARGKLFGPYFGGQAIVRTAANSGDSQLFVNSLAGFRFAPFNGRMVPVSSATPLAVTIKAAGDITGKLVTGVMPLNPMFPDGPGTLYLNTTLGAAVAAQSYVFAKGPADQVPLPFIVRANDRASSEAILATDKPTLQHVLAMKAKLVGLGVPRHPSTNTYHLHVDETFFPLINQDPAWQNAFRGAGLSPIFKSNAYVSAEMGITVIENNDSPALGRGIELQAGATPAQSVSMQDVGLDVKNSSGVAIRRAIMTGAEVLIESFVDEMEYLRLIGATPIHTINSLTVYAMPSGGSLAAMLVEGWRFLIRPPLDERALVATFTASATFDFVPGTDQYAATNSADQRPFKRAVGLEYGSTS